MPAITVAVTAYNLEKYLDTCMEQLLNQTFRDFEIVVYDDCSKDRTPEILQSYQEKIPERMQVILGHSPMRLPGRSRNAILDSGKIRGDYVVFLDGDDNVEPEFLERLYTAALRTQADVAICGYDRFEDATGHVLCEEMRGYPDCLTLNRDTAYRLAFINTALWNKLIRVELIGDLRMPEFAVGEDAMFLQNIYGRSGSLAFVDQICIHYRVHGSSVISNTPEQTIYSFAEELYEAWCHGEKPWIKDSLALVAFIHIGLSMPIRAYDNPNIDTGKILRWVHTYFRVRYHWFAGNPYFRFGFLRKQGIKGIGLWGALLCHRMGLFSLFLRMYKLAVNGLHMDIKF